MRAPDDFPTIFSGVNAEFLEDMFQQYQEAPETVAEDWQRFFSGLGNGNVGAAQNYNAPPAGLPGGSVSRPSDWPQGEVPATHGAPVENEVYLGKQSKVIQLINGYRNFGHTRANLDPLGRPHMKHPPDLSLAYFGLGEEDLDVKFSTGTLVAPPMATLREIYHQVSETYCESVGVEYMTITNHAQRIWLQQAMEGTHNKPRLDKEAKREIFEMLTRAEMFEKFLHTKFVGQKRFSLEGGETLIVMLEALVEESAEWGVKKIVIGMPHRGRINTLVNVMGKKPEMVFSEFKDQVEVNDLTGSGDVKYHKGYSSVRKTRSGANVELSLAFNPSHLEIVNPVVEGYVRAHQDYRGDKKGNEIMPVLMHGDAAFAGQGPVMETLNLSQLPGYKTGGTVHIIVNNQIGFTTSPRNSRSSDYPSDVVKMLNIPVIHVNGDDPEACFHAIKMGLAFRQYFHTDIVIDQFCYRRHGHNEMDEPGFTQPLTYQKIGKHPSTLELYKKKLVEEGSFTENELKKIQDDYRLELEKALEKTTEAETVKPATDTLQGLWTGLIRGDSKTPGVTEVKLEILKEIADKITTMPEGFHLHKRLGKLVENRRAMVFKKAPMDWAMGEALAYGTLLREGFGIRLSGQDVSRGTFSHRHANFVDVETGKDYSPFHNISPDQGRCNIIDSSLSEAGVLGFDFGYSLAEPYCLTIWEAQFGDFANGAQMVIDQFIAGSEVKWMRMSGIVLQLPHGMEGQGPEHSSARLERFLQMCAEDNMQVCSATTPAQFFHVLRRQMKRNFRKPLIMMSPKSLLRHPMAVSTTDDLIKGTFREVLWDRAHKSDKVKRISFCSGKVYYDLLAESQKRGVEDVALIRVEQLYPFPEDQVKEVIEHYPNVTEVVWTQEEPKNMGAWTHVCPYFLDLLPKKISFGHIGRKAAAAPATGSAGVHKREQAALVDETLTLKS